MSANNLFRSMVNMCLRGELKAGASLPSPQTGDVLEATPFSMHTLSPDSISNWVDCRGADARWAVASTLHFLAGTEDAGVLRKYNKYADRFLTGDRWIGAYGARAMPQLRSCAAELRANRSTRRAFVSIVDSDWPVHVDINIPACICSMQFIVFAGKLQMHVYQRSLNVWGVMPYDLVLVTTVHDWMSHKVGIAKGWLHWTIGSLHLPVADSSKPLSVGEDNVWFLPYCENPMQALEQPSTLYQPYRNILENKNELR